MRTDHLLILAVDQRPWLTQALYGHVDTATPEQRAAITRGKHVVLDGLLAAVADGGQPLAGAAILVDDQLGPGVAERARASGLGLSMPVERAGLAEYEDEPVDVAGWVAHHQPDLTKVLVRYNPDGDAASNARQLDRLAVTADTAHAGGSQFLFELLVPPTPAQLEAVDGDERRYADELRPALMQQAMAVIGERVDVDVWKLEHAGTEQDYRAVVALARAQDSSCILLGAGAPVDVVQGWLALAARSGFIGFAIGRSIWWDALRALLAGEIDDAEAVASIADRYRGFATAFEQAADPAAV